MPVRDFLDLWVFTGRSSVGVTESKKKIWIKRVALGRVDRGYEEKI